VKDQRSLTPTRQLESGTVTGPLVVAIERTWAAIQERHPDVPDVVLTLGNGSARPGQLTLGHFHDGKWATGDTRMPELFVGGEGLARGPRAVLGTLLHEATHGVAATRSIKDTSRQGRYHNARFRDLATELGIRVERDPRIGWSITTVPDTTAQHYGEQIAALDTAIKAHRLADVHGAGRTTSNNGLVATCACEPPRKIRLSRTAYDAGAITCGACETDFTARDANSSTDTARDARALTHHDVARTTTAFGKGDHLMDDGRARTIEQHVPQVAREQADPTQAGRDANDTPHAGPDKDELGAPIAGVGEGQADARERSDHEPRLRAALMRDQEESRRRIVEDPALYRHNAVSGGAGAHSAPPQRDHIRQARDHIRQATETDQDDDPVQRARTAIDQLVTRRREIEQQRTEATRTEQVNRWHQDDHSSGSVARAADGAVDGRGAAR
jgi:hypothetical protein